MAHFREADRLRGGDACAQALPGALRARCGAQPPGPDWDGAYTMESK